MKNKGSVYLLGIMAIIVWGIIIYKIMDALNEEEPNAPVRNITVNKEPLNEYETGKDTSTLKLNYRDPFTKNKLQKDTVQVPVAKLLHSGPSFLPKPVVNKPAINWSIIKYSGYIRNPHSKKLYALISLNGKSLMLTEGESSGEIKLIKNLGDSIKVSYQNHTKYISVNTGS